MITSKHKRYKKKVLNEATRRKQGNLRQLNNLKMLFSHWFWRTFFGFWKYNNWVALTINL